MKSEASVNSVFSSYLQIIQRALLCVDAAHLEVFEYSSRKLQAPVNIFRFRLRYAIKQTTNVTVTNV